MKKVINARIYENGKLAIDIGKNIEGEEMTETLARLFLLINDYQKSVKNINEKLTELMVSYKKEDRVLVVHIWECESTEYIDNFIEFNKKVKLKYNEFY